jgi:hypothetical protein
MSEAEEDELLADLMWQYGEGPHGFFLDDFIKSLPAEDYARVRRALVRMPQHCECGRQLKRHPNHPEILGHPGHCEFTDPYFDGGRVRE